MDRPVTIGSIVVFKFCENERNQQNNYATYAPAVITRVWSGTCVNLRILADGPGVDWRTSVVYGTDDYQWRWPDEPQPE